MIENIRIGTVVKPASVTVSQFCFREKLTCHRSENLALFAQMFGLFAHLLFLGKLWKSYSDPGRGIWVVATFPKLG